MKAFTVLDIFGHYIANEGQVLERRSQQISYRGPVLITMSKRRCTWGGTASFGFAKWADFEAWCNSRRGKVFAEARIVDCLRWPVALGRMPTQALRCCDRGDYVWVLGDVREVKPWACKGKLGLFDLQTEEERVAEKATQEALEKALTIENRWDEI